MEMFAQKPASGAQAQVHTQELRYGVVPIMGNYTGKTISELRASHGPAWRLPEDTVAQVGGRPVENDYVIKVDDTHIEFVRRQGEKG